MTLSTAKAAVRRRKARGAVLWGLVCLGLIQAGVAALIQRRLPNLRDHLYRARQEHFQRSVATAARLDAYLQGLSRRFNVPVIDARAWIDDEEAFNDSHHLKPASADRFSDRLCSEVLAPLLARREPLARTGR